MIFKGTATALITPFANGKLDVPALENLLDFQLSSGINAVVILGTTGEPATMSEEEKELVIRLAVKKLKGKFPIIVGAGSNNTEIAVKNAMRAERLGADGALSVTPYYNKCSKEGLKRHFEAVAKSVKFPVIAYNVPSRTGVNIEPKLLAETGLSNLSAVKEASGNIEQTEEFLRLGFEVFSGDDALTVPIMALGGSGVISVASNVYPSYVAKMTNAALGGDFPLAASMQLELFPLVKALFSEVNPIPVKCAAARLSLCKNELRLPLCELSSENVRKLYAAMDAFENLTD